MPRYAFRRVPLALLTLVLASSTVSVSGPWTQNLLPAAHAAVTASSTPSYTITDLGRQWADGCTQDSIPGASGSPGERQVAINDAGQVAGVTYITNPAGGNCLERAYTWSQSTGKTILPCGSSCVATAINGAGDIAGWNATSDSVYEHGAVWPSGTISAPIDLGSLDVGPTGQVYSSEAYGINRNRAVVGQSLDASGQYVHAFLWTQGGGLQDLHVSPLQPNTFSIAVGINASGTVVGNTNQNASNEVAVTWQNSVPTLISPAPGGYTRAAGINDSGEVVGDADGHAFYWTRSGGLVSLANQETALGAAGGSGLAVNSLGWIVGALDTPQRVSSFVYQNGVMYDLTTFFPADAGWSYVSADDINTSGQIVGTAIVNGHAHIFLMTPTGGTNRPPVAHFTMNDLDNVISATDGGTLSFTVARGYDSKVRVLLSAKPSVDPDGDTLTYSWIVDNTPRFNTSSNRDFAVDLGAGSHGVALKVTDSHGLTSVALGTVAIQPRDDQAPPLVLSWPFVSTSGWNNTAGLGTGDCRPGDHCGDDWFAQDWNWGGGNEDRGMVLLSPTDGTVVATPTVVPGYGQEVIIRSLTASPGDFVIRFTHLDTVWATPGQVVCAGTPVGTLGYTGLSGQGNNVSHLHAVAYVGIFQNSALKSDGYHRLVTPPTAGKLIENLSTAKPSRFAMNYSFDSTSRPQGCGSSFALEGRTTDSAGKGIGGVMVTLTGQSSDSATTIGQGSGHFAFSGLTPGAYTITPTKQGCRFVPESATVTVTNSHVSLPSFSGAGRGC